MTETPKIALPPVEIERQKEEAELLNALAANRTRRQVAKIDMQPNTDGTIGPVLVCPFCGSDDLQYEETAGLHRSVEGLRTADEIVGADPDDPPTLCIDGHYDVGDEGADDPRLWCRDCYHESQPPPELTLDFG